MLTMQIKCLKRVIIGSQFYEKGAVVPKVSTSDGENLILRGAAVKLPVKRKTKTK